MRILRHFVRTIVATSVGAWAWWYTRSACLFCSLVDEATIGPVSYIGCPLPTAITAPGLTIMHTLFSFRRVRYWGNLVIWCLVVNGLFLLPKFVRWVAADKRRIRGCAAIVFCLFSFLCLGAVLFGRDFTCWIVPPWQEWVAGALRGVGGKSRAAGWEAMGL